MIKRCCCLIAVVSFMALGLAGCHKESTAIPAYLQNPALTGKWFLKSLIIKTSADTSTFTGSDTVKMFTAQDFFEFKAQNAATYSSTLLGKSYDGYYSANSGASPYTLTFKSGDFINKFNIGSISKDSLVIYQPVTTTNGIVTTTIAYNYIYTR